MNKDIEQRRAIAAILQPSLDSILGPVLARFGYQNTFSLSRDGNVDKGLFTYECRGPTFALISNSDWLEPAPGFSLHRIKDDVVSFEDADYVSLGLLALQLEINIDELRHDYAKPFSVELDRKLQALATLIARHQQMLLRPTDELFSRAQASYRVP